MSYFLLFYDKAEDYQTRQTAYAAGHREHIARYVSSGSLLLGGNLDGPHALVLFSCPNESVVREFAQGDPYVVNGVVRQWTVRPWDLVVGTLIPLQ